MGRTCAVVAAAAVQRGHRRSAVLVGPVAAVSAVVAVAIIIVVAAVAAVGVSGGGHRGAGEARLRLLVHRRCAYEATSQPLPARKES